MSYVQVVLLGKYNAQGLGQDYELLLRYTKGLPLCVGGGGWVCVWCVGGRVGACVRVCVGGEGGCMRVCGGGRVGACVRVCGGGRVGA